MEATHGSHQPQLEALVEGLTQKRGHVAGHSLDRGPE